MAEANGHAMAAHTPDGGDIYGQHATSAEVDGLLAGLFEPVIFEIAPGKLVEIRPLLLAQADRLYSGELKGADLQRYLLSRAVYVNGRPLGDDNVARLPMSLAQKLVPAVMRANGMEGFMQDADESGDGGQGAADPKG